MVGNAIIDDEAVCEAAKQEIIRRYFNTACAARKGLAEQTEVYKLELMMKSLGITPENNRACVKKAHDIAEETGSPALAIELSDGTVVTGKTSSLLGASSAALLNALKILAGIDDSIHLISPTVIEPIQHLKVEHMGNSNPRLHLDEVLIALSICAVTDKNAEKAIAQISKLRGCEAHSSVILADVDKNVFSKLGVNVTCRPAYQTKKLYHR